MLSLPGKSSEVIVKLSSKRALARAIVVKLLSPEIGFWLRRSVRLLLRKSRHLSKYCRTQLGSLLREQGRLLADKLVSLRQRSGRDVLVYLLQQPGIFLKWLSSRKLPSVRQVFTFLGQEVVANVVAWTAALVSSQLISKYFTVKSWKNGWGLLGKQDKTVISQETYQMLDWWAAYLMGLLMLLLVHRLINKLYQRARALKTEAQAEVV